MCNILSLSLSVIYKYKLVKTCKTYPTINGKTCIYPKILPKRNPTKLPLCKLIFYRQ